MSKKLILFAAMAISAVALSVPAIASAAPEDIPLHIVPKPTGASVVSGGGSTLTTTDGKKVTCKKLKGTANWESSTTGTLNLTFEEDCTATIGGVTVSCSSITTGTLPFHLVTIPGVKAGEDPHVPGVLITKPAAAPFAKFSCSIFSFEVLGNGIIGTITSPACGASANQAVISFASTEPGMSKHKKVVAKDPVVPATTFTTEQYNLTQAGSEAAMDATGTVTFSESTKLECT